jgi:hypothetical protein
LSPLYRKIPASRSLHRLGSHVGARIHAFLWILRHLRVESLLNLLEHVLVRIVADKRDTQTLGTETPSTTYAVQVGVGVGGEVVVDGEVDALDVDTTAEDVGGDADTLVELLEFLVTLDPMAMLALVVDTFVVSDLPLLLTDARVHRNTGEVALA